MDLYDRYPVSFVVSDKNDTALANESLEIYHDTYPEAIPIYLSDRAFSIQEQHLKQSVRAME